MRLLLILAAVFASVISPLTAPPSFGQDQPHENVRKIVNKIAPSYPEIARKMNVQGNVRLRVTVARSGTVRSIEALGGGPVLIKAAQDAVYKWKWERSPEETKESIEFHFQPE
jgi:TonB family protein